MNSSKEELIRNFDSSGVGSSNSGIFGLPFLYEHAEVVIIPVPWDLTVSYLAGTANGPEAIRQYASQIDLFDWEIAQAWQLGIFMQDPIAGMKERGQELRKKVARYIQYLETSGEQKDLPDWAREILAKANKAGEFSKQQVFAQANAILNDGKLPIVLGGDHSSPLGLIEALAQQYSAFGILQIDAHLDLRKAYEGFENSHASIMYNAMKLPQVSALVSVGIRDFCEDEVRLIEEQNGRIVCHYDQEYKNEHLAGTLNWSDKCSQIISELPENVYVSFDIDGLQPFLCPDTGTPVPGGLTFEEASMLLSKLAASGKKIIGADLCEVSLGEKYPLSDSAKEWNANVGARILYKLCNYMGRSNELI